MSDATLTRLIRPTIAAACRPDRRSRRIRQDDGNDYPPGF
ncbi:hypothetical protein L343_2900 [Escherichia coli CE549]|nr:hypothetical protein L343_2900 [Escherichia coli CE549]